MLFSVKPQHESAIGIHISPPFGSSFPSSSPSQASRLIQSPYLSFLSHTENSRWLSILHPANFPFDNLIKRFLDVNFFESILFGVCWGFWIYRLVFHQIWDSSSHYLFFQYVFYIFFFLCSLSGTLILPMWACLMVSHYLTACVHLHSFFFCFLAWIISTDIS